MCLYDVLNILLISLLVLIVADFLWKIRLILATRKFDGPFYVPVIGNAIILYTKQDDLLQTLYQMFLKYKTPFRVWLGPKLLIGSTNMNHIEKILTSSKLANKCEFLYKGLKPYLGEGLIPTSGPNHRKHRQIIQPIINLQFSSSIIPILQENIKIYLKTLENHNNYIFNIWKFNYNYFVDCFGEFIMGTKINAQIGENEKFAESAIVMFYFFVNKLMKPWLKINFIYKFTKDYRKHTETVKEFRTFGEKAFQQSENRIKSQKHNSETARESLIDKIMTQVENDPNIFSRTEVIDHILTIYMASVDTLSNISSFSTICFGLYPECQQRAYNEIRELIGDQVPESITVSDLNKLTYMDRCLKEVLRLFPGAPYIARNVEEDLELDSIKIPKGVGVIVPIFNLHHSPKYWEKPYDFYPEHFLEEAVKQRPSYAYAPFSAGTRGCLGKVLATMCLKLYFCHLLLKYEISADASKLEDLKLVMDITTRSKYGYKIKLVKRRQN